MIDNEWNFTPLGSIDRQDRLNLAQKWPEAPVIAQLLTQRGITTDEEADKFFRPSLADLHDPFLMPGMDKAVARLNHAMGKKEKIMIYGDYDVDGTTAVALVYKYLRGFYSNIDYSIPTREDHGYGITHRAIDEFKEMNVGLVIILDCGIKAIGEVAYAKSLGIDFIICDHHVSDSELPDAAAILNPKLEGNT